MAEKKYDSSAIEVIEGLEAVRKRPGMYIGDTNLRGLHHMFKEIVDNSVDEHLAGHAKNIIVTLTSNGAISVEDDGRGIPVDIHPKTKRPTIETIFTTLHSGGKFGGENSGYKMSGGLHGVGSSVVNALSTYLKVTVWKDKFEYKIEFGNGGKVTKSFEKIGPTNKKGTKVEFKPDGKIFSSTNFNSNTISNRLKELAFLNNGLKITFKDLMNEQEHVYFYEDGLLQYVKDLTANHKPLAKPFSFENESSKITIKVAMQYTSSDIEHIVSFVNNIPTPGGGSHDVSFKGSLLKAVNDYASEYNLLEGGRPFEADDVREGLFAVVSVYVVEEYLQFEGQTKDKLSSPAVKTYADKVIYEQIKHLLTKNKAESQLIIKKASDARKAREAAKKAREISRELTKSSKKSFVGKLVTAQTNKPENAELFIVEGDSAGGSAKLGRDRKTQAILPLKGKIINTEKANLKNIIANEELNTLIHAIGAGLGEDFKVKDVNYGKIIIMTDADTDGAHIQALLLTFFYRFMNELIQNGLVYIALPPLYKIKNKNTKAVQYVWTDEELNKIKQGKSNLEIQRYKGLGEMNYEQLWETTMDPKTRSLIKVTVDDAEQASKIIDILMGQDPEPRREWIENNVEFVLDDEIIVENSGVKTIETNLENKLSKTLERQWIIDMEEENE